MRVVRVVDLLETVNERRCPGGIENGNPDLSTGTGLRGIHQRSSVMMRLSFLGVTVSGFLAAQAAAADPAIIRMMTPFPTLPAEEGFRAAVNSELSDLARVEFVRPVADILTAVRSGEVDLAVIPSEHYAASKTGRFALFEIPFTFNDLKEVALFQASAIGDAMIASVAEEGLVGLGYWNVGMARLFGHSVQRFNDIKIRTQPLGITSGMLKALGAIPVPLPTSELPEAFVKGTVQAFYALPSFVASDERLLTKAVMETGFTPELWLVVANEAAWDKFAFRIQSVLSAQVQLAGQKQTSEARRHEEESLSTLQVKGVQPIPISQEELGQLRKAVEVAWNSAENMQKDRLVTIALRAIKQQREHALPTEREKRTSVPAGKANILFATNRKDESSSDPAFRFGSSRGELLYGTVRLRLGRGRYAAPERSDETKIEEIDLFADDKSFLAALTQGLNAADRKDILIYVHGFNNSFRDALEAGSLLASDINFRGILIVFSWPSDGSTVPPRYLRDGTQTELSSDSFVNFISLIRNVDKLNHLHILTHSMGGRLVKYALESAPAQQLSAGGPFLQHLIFAAPDVDSEVFKQAIAGFARSASRVSLYVSSYDQALVCAQLAYEGLRAGQAGPGIVVDELERIDTIDVTNVETPGFLVRLVKSEPIIGTLYYWLVEACRSGHSYMTRNDAVLADLNSLIVSNASPAHRIRLTERRTNGLRYWEFRQVAR
jgi:esterase/lipase superfamily enzyme/TRAP-type C4-dicarboxylate transport system substrate-binding protein